MNQDGETDRAEETPLPDQKPPTTLFVPFLAFRSCKHLIFCTSEEATCCFSTTRGKVNLWDSIPPTKFANEGVLPGKALSTWVSREILHLVEKTGNLDVYMARLFLQLLQVRNQHCNANVESTFFVPDNCKNRCLPHAPLCPEELKLSSAFRGGLRRPVPTDVESRSLLNPRMRGWGSCWDPPPANNVKLNIDLSFPFEGFSLSTSYGSPEVKNVLQPSASKCN